MMIEYNCSTIMDLSDGRCMDDGNDFIPKLTLDNDSSMFSRLKACVDHNDDSYD